MIKRGQYKEITTTGGGGSGATQNEIYQIFEGTNPQGIANSLFETLSGNNNALSNLLIEDKSGNFDTAANLLFFLAQYLSPNSNNGLNIANQLSETISGGDQTLANLLVDTNSGSNESAANLLYSIDINTTTTNNNLGSARQPEILRTSASGTITQQPHNISFANIGSANGTITVNGTLVTIEPGLTVDYNAGGNGNKFNSNAFSYNATGTTFLITYVR
jgi:hypothetical protein